MKKSKFLISFFTGLLLMPSFHSSTATHVVFAYLQFEKLDTPDLTYKVDVFYYTDPSAGVDRELLTIEWGDGNSSNLPRTNGVPGGADSIPQGVMIAPNLKESIYSGVHTYQQLSPYYVISFTDPNRIANILNINGGNSVLTPYYIEDTIFMYDENIVGTNQPPMVTNLAIVDTAYTNIPYHFNYGFYDPDGDSLHFRLVPPKQAPGASVPNYQYPDEVMSGPNNNFSINENTGEISWDSPKQVGYYAVNILMTELRNEIKLGTYSIEKMILVLPGVSSANDLLLQKMDFTVYPNPFHDKLFVEIENASVENLMIHLYDLSGKQITGDILSHKVLSEKIIIQTGNQLPAGNYILEISDIESRQSFSYPVIKME